MALISSRISYSGRALDAWTTAWPSLMDAPSHEGAATFPHAEGLAAGTRTGSPRQRDRDMGSQRWADRLEL